jgi:hypothetical protein
MAFPQNPNGMMANMNPTAGMSEQEVQMTKMVCASTRTLPHASPALKTSSFLSSYHRPTETDMTARSKRQWNLA